MRAFCKWIFIRKKATHILEINFHTLSEERVVCLWPSNISPKTPSLKRLLRMTLLFVKKKNIQETFLFH